MHRFLLSLVLLITSGCASRGAVVIDDLSIALVDLQKTVTDVLPLGKRSQTQNTRGYYSNYFITKKGEYEEANDAPIRNFAEIFILGDRRPYSIEVRVITEKRQINGDYTLIKYDEGLARVISRRIQMSLHKRREDRNIIDDFRVF